MSRLSHTSRVARQKRPRIGNRFGWLLVLRKRRLVRITARNQPAAMTGNPTAATFAFVDLDEEQIDRLIRRLQAIRGGKKALP